MTKTKAVPIRLFLIEKVIDLAISAKSLMSTSITNPLQFPAPGLAHGLLMTKEASVRRYHGL